MQRAALRLAAKSFQKLKTAKRSSKMSNHFTRSTSAKAKKELNIQEESTIIYFTASPIYQPSIVSTLPPQYVPPHPSQCQDKRER
jgi:hypothetical protein